MLPADSYEWHEISCIRQATESMYTCSQFSHRRVLARISSRWTPSTAASVPTVMTELEVSTVLEPPFLSLYNLTLWQLLWIPQRVIARRVSHKFLSECAHCLSFIRGYDSQASGHQIWIFCRAIFGGGGEHLDGVHTTADKGKVVKFRREGTVLVVDLVLSAWGCPVGCVPDGGIERHWLRWVVSSHGLSAANLPDWRFINVEAVYRNMKTNIFIVKQGFG